MADLKLSQRTQTVLIANGVIYITLPDGLGGYVDYKINVSDLQKDLSDRITVLESASASTLKTEAKTDQTVDFTFDILNAWKLESIDVRVVSNGTLKIGTTVGGTEVMSLRTITTAEDLNYPKPKTFISNTTLYFTVTGSLNININYREDQF